jgi:GNAT superfamily N-acetyltransferase
MIDLAQVAKLEEARLAIGMASVAVEHRALAGGMLARGEPGTWINTATGMGMNGPVSDEEIEEFIAWYESAGVEPRIEICPFADASLVGGLAARGFRLKQFENVFFRETGESVPPSPLGDGIEVGLLDPQDEKSVWEYAAAVARGFMPDGKDPDAGDVELTARVVRQPAVLAFAAKAEGRIVGGGSIEIPAVGGPKAAALFALAVLPSYRRRGVQQALIAARLRAASDAGATVVTISALPGVATERNARRMGFQVAYTKAVLIRPGAGLVANRW